MRKRSYFRWITDTDNKETDEKGDTCSRERGRTRWTS